jgi:hypothetical protein
MADLPRFSQDELVPLLELRRQYPHEFMSNKTEYFQREMARYIEEKRVWRNSIMGETRGGKSEVGSTISFWYVNLYNHFYDKPDFRKSFDFKKGEILIQKIEFGIDFVYDNQMVYKSKQKDRVAKNQLIYAQIHQIDEHKTSIGGIGSFSEIIETENINNISAKYNQSEIWIEPDALQTMNCPFGLEVKKKDTVCKVNWCILWKIDALPTGGTQFKFVGWVKIPLHSNQEFRDKYNQLKNSWIRKELSGRNDERNYRRLEAVKYILKHYPNYFVIKENGKPAYGSGKITDLVRLLMVKGELDSNFNNEEIISIVNQCYLLNENPELMEKGKKLRA